VADELLTQGETLEDKFIGAQTLNRKLQSDFDQISTGKKDDPVIALRNNLFKILQTADQRLVCDTLCKTIAFIALKSSNTFWPESVAEIAAFGTQSSQTCYAAVVILKDMALIFD